MFDLWHVEVKRYLSVNPVERAAQDRQTRVNALQRAKEREREEPAKELAYERWCKQGYQPFLLLRPTAPPRAAQLGAEEETDLSRPTLSTFLGGVRHAWRMSRGSGPKTSLNTPSKETICQEQEYVLLLALLED